MIIHISLYISRERQQTSCSNNTIYDLLFPRRSDVCFWKSNLLYTCRSWVALQRHEILIRIHYMLIVTTGLFISYWVNRMNTAVSIYLQVIITIMYKRHGMVYIITGICIVPLLIKDNAETPFTLPVGNTQHLMACRWPVPLKGCWPGMTCVVHCILGWTRLLHTPTHIHPRNF